MNAKEANMNIRSSGMDAVGRARAMSTSLALVAALGTFSVRSDVTVVPSGEIRTVEAEEDSILEGQWIVAGTLRKSG